MLGTFKSLAVSFLLFFFVVLFFVLVMFILFFSCFNSKNLILFFALPHNWRSKCAAFSLSSAISLKISNYFLSFWSMRICRMWTLWSGGETFAIIDILYQVTLFFKLKKHSAFSQALESLQNSASKVLAMFFSPFFFQFPLYFIYMLVNTS